MLSCLVLWTNCGTETFSYNKNTQEYPLFEVSCHYDFFHICNQFFMYSIVLTIQQNDESHPEKEWFLYAWSSPLGTCWPKSSLVWRVFRTLQNSQLHDRRPWLSFIRWVCQDHRPSFTFCHSWRRCNCNEPSDSQITYQKGLQSLVWQIT